MFNCKKNCLGQVVTFVVLEVVTTVTTLGQLLPLAQTASLELTMAGKTFI